MLIMALNRFGNRRTSTASTEDVFRATRECHRHERDDPHERGNHSGDPRAAARSPSLIGGFGIIKPPLLDLAPQGTTFLPPRRHAQYRGQPPAFWELYNGEQRDRGHGAAPQPRNRLRGANRRANLSDSRGRHPALAVKEDLRGQHRHDDRGSPTTSGVIVPSRDHHELRAALHASESPAVARVSRESRADAFSSRGYGLNGTGTSAPA